MMTIAEISGPEIAVSLLARIRRLVNQVGSHQITAALHLYLAEIETKRGLFDTVKRHLRTGEALLQLDPNAWLEGLAAVASLCVSFLGSDLDHAVSEACRALRLARLSGHAVTRMAAASNLGHIYLALGKRDKARRWLERAFSQWPQGGGGRIAILDGLAQIALAEADFRGCQQYLSLVTRQTGFSPESPSYYQLCTFQTKARLLIAQGQVHESGRFLTEVLPYAERSSVPAVTTLLRLLKAETLLMTGRERDAAALIGQAAASDTHSIEVLAETARVAGKALAQAGHTTDATVQFERALTILAGVGNVQAQSHVRKTYHEAVPTAPPDTTPISAAIAIGQAAASVDLAAYPEILGREVLSLLRGTGAAAEVVLIAGEPPASREIVAHAGCDRRRARTLAASATAATRLQLGVWRDRPYELVITPVDAVQPRLTTLAITRIAETAVALERARREERERTALWPVEPREESDGPIFASRATIEVAATGRKVAPSNYAVLLTGETGTGKEVLAKEIHRASRRADKPLVPFNCNAVPRDLVDSQLFGYRRGAFTGAHADSPGIIRAAAGGTLFLDEIGELGLDVQPKLLRFLESSEILPLGESRPTTVDVRVIASTNADLGQLVKEGRFREDLYYRLKVINLHLPPLRERREEIPPLVDHFLERFARECQHERLAVAEETMEYLLLYRWPGNVRELANEMRRLAILAESGAILMPEHLSPEIVAARRTVPVAARKPGPREIIVRTDQTLSAAVDHLERTMILQALAASHGRLGPAAKALGLSRKGLYLKRRRLGLAGASTV
jgi:DNA-binding NtrC family response regulator/tetratricopeptide (TPR) repeat protein